MSTPIAKSLASFNLSGVVAAQAGNTTMQADMLRAAVFNAFKLTFKDGNKNQLIGRANSLYEQARLFSDMGAAKDHGFAKPKVAARLYAAHLSALALFNIPQADGVPALGKLTAEELRDIDVDTAASDATDRYLAQVRLYMEDAAAADAAKKEARKEAKAKADGEGVGEGEGEGTASVPADAVVAESADSVTMDTGALVTALADAIQSGMLSDAELTIIRNALALHAADVALAAAATSAADVVAA